ncbi:MBG domain-containing protein [Aureibacter tunicatorum]|uniref:Gliding motility-associated-like protein n=1 Tax=Aureibacter tunicatorum TaxID=866807 RepID=A0AAE3XNW0_9BACT|nr:MBG domain-containing protein [Aureibacter tunicatorum]MDR6239206.1 gliding motility-associated-like protein [Aureibacter tunicatorum]BDD04868.1 hypothetical protein AUTU_23510 [Aureibacter tunicatorum]
MRALAFLIFTLSFFHLGEVLGQVTNCDLGDLQILKNIQDTNDPQNDLGWEIDLDARTFDGGRASWTGAEPRRVTSIRLYYERETTGVFDLRGLDELKEVVIHYSGASGILLDENQQLKELELNNLDESMTAIDLTTQNELEDVDLRGNDLSEVELSNSKETLKRLDISSNPIKEFDPTIFIHLEYLRINSTHVKSLDFTGLDKLTSLGFGSNDIETYHLADLPALEYVYFRGPWTSGDPYKKMKSITFANLPKLKVLDGEQNSLTTLDIDFLQTLETINLERNDFESLPFNGLLALKNLDFSKNPIEGVLDLTSFPALEEFNVNSCNLSDVLVQDISKLKKVDLSWNKFKMTTQLRYLGIPEADDLYHRGTMLILDHNVKVGEVIDLTGELIINGNETEYHWKAFWAHTYPDLLVDTETEPNPDAPIRLVAPGKYMFKKPGEYYCFMGNETYGPYDPYQGVQSHPFTVTHEPKLIFEDEVLTFGDADFLLEADTDAEVTVVYEFVGDDNGNRIIYNNGNRYLNIRNAGEIKIKAIIPERDGYLAVEKIATFIILPKEVVITPDDLSKVYGENDPDFSFASEGLLQGYSISGMLNREDGENAGTYKFELGTLSVHSNFTLKLGDHYFEVLRKTITVSAVDHAKNLGASDPALTYNADQLINGDQFSGSLMREAGESEGEYPILLGTLTAGSNYDIIFDGATFTILNNTFDLTIRANTKNKVYGNMDPELDYIVEGLQNGDQMIGDLTRVAGEEAGVYAIQQGSLDVNTNGNRNYRIVYESADFTINKRLLTISVEDKSKTYGDNDPVFTYQVTGLVDGDQILGELEREIGEDIGNYIISQGTMNVDKTDNYDLTFERGNLTILKLNAVVNITAKEASKVYGEQDPELEYEVSGLEAGGMLSGKISREIGENAGVYSIGIGSLAISSNLNINYSINFVESEFQIIKKNLSIVAEDKSKIFGEADPELTFVATGLVFGDQLQGSLQRLAGEDVGDYLIRQGTLTPDKPENYALVFHEGDFKISPKEVVITVTANDVRKTYGDDDPLLSFMVEGLREGDGMIGQLERVSGEDIGDYAIRQGSLTAETTNENISYAVDFIGANLSIDKKSLILTVENKTKISGNNDPELTYKTIGLVDGDNLSGKLIRQNGEEAGTYEILQGTLNAGNNYELIFIKGVFTIIENELIPIRVQINSVEKEYGEVDPDLVYDVISNDYRHIVSGKPSRVEGENVGEYAISGMGLSVPNGYELVYDEAFLKINPAIVTITVHDHKRLFGEENPEFTFQAEGFKNEDDINVLLLEATLNCEADRDSEPGVYAIEMSQIYAQNYEFEIFDGVLTVLPEVEVQGIITANGDGHNDTWRIKNAEMYEKLRVSVYSPDGKRVYFTENYNEENNWEPSDDQQGNYSYVIETSTGEKFTGFLLIKNQ